MQCKAQAHYTVAVVVTKVIGRKITVKFRLKRLILPIALTTCLSKVRLVVRLKLDSIITIFKSAKEK